MNPGRINQHNLRLSTIHDSEDAISGGLGPRRHNRDFLSHQTVYERGLPGVRSSEDRDKTGTK